MSLMRIQSQSTDSDNKGFRESKIQFRMVHPARCLRWWGTLLFCSAVSSNIMKVHLKVLNYPSDRLIRPVENILVDDVDIMLIIGSYCNIISDTA